MERILEPKLPRTGVHQILLHRGTCLGARRHLSAKGLDLAVVGGIKELDSSVFSSLNTLQIYSYLEGGRLEAFVSARLGQVELGGR